MLCARIVSSLLLLSIAAVTAAAAPRPIPVKVVVVAMFEAGADTGDTPGELLSHWPFYENKIPGAAEAHSTP